MADNICHFEFDIVDIFEGIFLPETARFVL